jgi:Animal haem peroxidase
MGLLTRPLIALASRVDRKYGWDRLPTWPGLLTLVYLRKRLREENLHDTGLVKQAPPEPPDFDVRTVDGSYNDLGKPSMGSVGTRFGRNVPIPRTYPEEPPDLLDPSPRLVSRELLTRETFIPVTSVNVLAAAWLQFEVHDWFSHEPDEDAQQIDIPLADDDEWEKPPMLVKPTLRDTSGGGGADTPATFATHDSHWWDGSQIYGKDEAFASRARAHEDGKLRIEPDGLPPADLVTEEDLEGVAGNFWVGLGLLHTLFMLEHNAICDALRREHPDWTDDKLYNKARLVNAALMAKIHTVEWTPAIIAHPTTIRGMNANWYGLMGERWKKRIGRFVKNEVLTGIPGSATDHHKVPYSLTEEFVAVYRMHPLVPDDYTFRSAANDEELGKRTFRELGARETRGVLLDFGMANGFYSFGRAHPGLITLHNYPKFLQEFRRPDGEVVDLAAVDILRVRERGVPRYREFRELMHRKPVSSFEELTGDAKVAQELREVYGELDRLDLMTGLYAEPLPKGFGFSDTAFRIFVLMASRRLKSDRFFTKDYTPETYTQTGLDWIDRTTMREVLLRHYPELGPALAGVTNTFQPWTRVQS